MKLLTLNFLTCARKTCKSTAAAFPLHPKEAELEQIEIDMNPTFIKNMLPRLDWEAIKQLSQEVYFLCNMTCISFFANIFPVARPSNFTS
jgi:multifunctional methyltransferase subunit TRM112